MVTKRRQYRCIHDYDVLLENYIKLKTYMPTKFGKENTGLAKKYHIQQPYIVADKQLHSIVTGSNFEVSTIPNVRPLALLIPLGARNTKARPSFLSRLLVWWQPADWLLDHMSTQPQRGKRCSSAARYEAALARRLSSELLKTDTRTSTRIRAGTDIERIIP